MAARAVMKDERRCMGRGVGGGGSAQINRDQPLGIAAARPRGSKRAPRSMQMCAAAEDLKREHAANAVLFSTRAQRRLRLDIQSDLEGWGRDGFIPRLATVRVCVFGKARQD